MKALMLCLLLSACGTYAPPEEHRCPDPAGSYVAQYVLTQGPADCPHLDVQRVQMAGVRDVWRQLWAGSGPQLYPKPAQSTCGEAWGPKHFVGGTLAVQHGELVWNGDTADGELQITSGQGSYCMYRLEIYR